MSCQSLETDIFSPHSTIIRYSTQTLALEIVAYRDIEPGEEITLSCMYHLLYVKTNHLHCTQILP